MRAAFRHRAILYYTDGAPVCTYWVSIAPNPLMRDDRTALAQNSRDRYIWAIIRLDSFYMMANGGKEGLRSRSALANAKSYFVPLRRSYSERAPIIDFAIRILPVILIRGRQNGGNRPRCRQTPQVRIAIDKDQPNISGVRNLTSEVRGRSLAYGLSKAPAGESSYKAP